MEWRCFSKRLVLRKSIANTELPTETDLWTRVTIQISATPTLATMKAMRTTYLLRRHHERPFLNLLHVVGEGEEQEVAEEEEVEEAGEVVEAGHLTCSTMPALKLDCRGLQLWRSSATIRYCPCRSF